MYKLQSNIAHRDEQGAIQTSPGEVGLQEKVHSTHCCQQLCKLRVPLLILHRRVTSLTYMEDWSDCEKENFVQVL